MYCSLLHIAHAWRTSVICSSDGSDFWMKVDTHNKNVRKKIGLQRNEWLSLDPCRKFVSNANASFQTFLLGVYLHTEMQLLLQIRFHISLPRLRQYTWAVKQYQKFCKHVSCPWHFGCLLRWCCWYLFFVLLWALPTSHAANQRRAPSRVCALFRAQQNKYSSAELRLRIMFRSWYDAITV